MNQPEVAVLIASLKAAGADRLDPVRFHYFEALAQRAQQQGEAVRRLVDDKLTNALLAYRDRYEQAAAAPRPSAPPPPEGPGALARLVAEHAPAAAGSRAELKAIRQFRNTWSKLAVDRQLAQALEQAPANAGPLNSHFLVLRSLEVMRDISPDYLARFMAHVDALLCLDQEAEKSKLAAKAPAKTRRKKAEPTKA